MFKNTVLFVSALCGSLAYASEQIEAIAPDATLYVTAEQCRLVTKVADVVGPCSVFVKNDLLMVRPAAKSGARVSYTFTNKSIAAGSNIKSLFSRALRDESKAAVILQREQPSTDESGEGPGPSYVPDVKSQPDPLTMYESGEEPAKSHVPEVML